MTNTLNIVLITLVIYIIYSNFLCKKETFAMSQATITQLKSTSTENSQFLCKDCGSTNILIEHKRRNYG
jgi:predicted RNA-binding Zn-ribbon protein involved in translation (DUF1610 family)